MSLGDRIEEELKTAMRAKDVVARETLRMVIAGFKNRRIELGADLTDEERLAVLVKAVKSRHESASEYAKAGRPELAEKELAEVAVLEGYLPRQLGEAELRADLQAMIAELGLTSPKEMGQLMKAVKAKHGAAVDGKLASRLAGELLRG
jgi:uncharacterized protein